MYALIYKDQLYVGYCECHNDAL